MYRSARVGGLLESQNFNSGSTISRKKIKEKRVAKNALSDVQWDDSFSIIKRSANEKFLLRSSGTKLTELYTIEERLKRFNLKASIIDEDSGCCIEKRELDRTIDKPKSLLLPKLKGKKNMYSDPSVDKVIADMTKHYEKQRQLREYKDREMLFKQALNTIPDVHYYPSSLASSMKEVNFRSAVNPELSQLNQDFYPRASSG